MRWRNGGLMVLIVSTLFFGFQTPALAATPVSSSNTGQTSTGQTQLTSGGSNSGVSSGTTTSSTAILGALSMLAGVANGMGQAITGEDSNASLSGVAQSATPLPTHLPTLSTTTYYVVKGSMLYKHDSSGFTYVVGPAPAFMTVGTLYYAYQNQFYSQQGSQFVYAGQYENPYRTMDLRSKSAITADKITAFIQANDPLSPLISLAPVYLQAQATYGVNAQYLVAHSIIESTWGSSIIAHDKNNLFGYSAYDSSPYASATTFPTKAFAILYEAWFVRKFYLDSGGPYYHGPTLDGMNVDYATDPNWSESIAAVMWNMAPISQTVTDQALAEATAPPVFGYPVPVKGQVTTDGLHVRSGPGLSYPIVDQYKNRDSVSIVGWFPGWYEIAPKQGSTPVFVSSQYVKTTTLGEINADNVNLRAGPNLLSPIMAHLQSKTQVELIHPLADKQWDYVSTLQNVTGYVYASYVSMLQ